jgi:hypothetical protein
MKYKRFNYIFIFIFFIFILLSVFVSCSDNSKESNEIPFDSNQWKTGDQRVRARMSRDLLEKNILIGKNEGEILDILGSPDDKRPDRFTYFLETEFMGPWRMFLNVDFKDSTKRVYSVWITD